MNFYKRYLGDYARDTAHLSLMEHGAYQVLLDTYYATGGKLPQAKDELYRIARAMSAAERKAVGRVADQFFAVNGDGARHNKRADEELNTYGTQAETNRRIAVERELRRKQHEQSTNRATNGEPKPEARSQKPERAKGAARRSPGTPFPSDFEVTEAMSDWALTQGLPAERVMPESQKFMAHHEAKGSTFSDWVAAWRNWILKAVEFGGFKP
jgi:uncharacterized protein YdaU (DUF1376 family)